MRIAALVLILAGCNASTSVTCDDGHLCPNTFTCAPAGGCYSPDERAACEGRDDGAACTTSDGNGFCAGGGCATIVCGNGITEQGEMCDDGNTTSRDGCNGTCTSNEACGNAIVENDEQCDVGPAGDATCDTLCRSIRCGNHILEGAEPCDDGNTVPRDGCNADCTSTEICGNAYVDFQVGEACDDGNAIAFDGCSRCEVEPFAWRKLAAPAMPSARNAAAMAFDLARHRIVVFGGHDAATQAALADTWEFDGIVWAPRATTIAPRRRESAAMVYDPKRGRTVLFGGLDGSVALDDTWDFDGIAWTKLDPPIKPPARHSAAAAYDPIRRRVVVFGGNGPRSDTWEFDGVMWTERTFATPTPPARGEAAMAFDAARGKLVLHGGRVDAITTLADTWELDASGWTQRASSPNAHAKHAMYDDAIRHRIVVVGYPGTGMTDEVVEFDGAAWTPRTTTPTPVLRSDAATAFDLDRDRFVAFGGVGSSGTIIGDAIELAGSSWSIVSLPAVPPLRSDLAIVDDVARGRVVAFGGMDAILNDVSNATWELAGDAWRLVSDPPDNSPLAPSQRRSTAMAYDLARKRVVLFGGRGGGAGGFVGDTWVYDGAWTKLATTGPSPRFDHAMAYDARRDRVVLFGGFDGATAGDTWEFDGASWTHVTPTASPPARGGAAMAYDAARGTIVLFGGATETVTWEYDGATWSSVATATTPPSRSRAGLVFDVARSRIVLYGGNPSGAPLADVWEYDGTNWTPPDPYDISTQPIAREITFGATYSVARRSVVIAGGRVGSFETTELGFVPIARGEVCTSTIDGDRDGIVGCADPECWDVCTPTCPIGAPAVECLSTPRCGDGICSPIESCRTCADCTCTPMCGDTACDAPETLASCPGDCF